MLVQKSVNVFVLAQELVLVHLVEVFEVRNHLFNSAAGLRKYIVFSSNDSTVLALDPIFSCVRTPESFGVTCGIGSELSEEPFVTVIYANRKHRNQIDQRHIVLSKEIWKWDEALTIGQESQIALEDPEQKDYHTHANDGGEKLQTVRSVASQLQEKVLVKQSLSLVAALLVEVGFFV